MDKSLALPTLLLVALVGFILAPKGGEMTESVLRGETSIRYCSDPTDSRCEDGVAVVDILLSSRNRWFSSLYEYPVPESVAARVDRLDVRLGGGWELWFDEDELIDLYLDTDGSGTFAEGDELRASGLLKGRHLVFETLGLTMSAETGGLDVDTGLRLFIVRASGGYPDALVEEDGELTDIRVFNGVTTESVDLGASDVGIPMVGSVADKSFFMYHDRLGESIEETVERYPWMARDAEGGIVVGPGTLEIREDVIVPSGGHVSVVPGTTILLGAGRSFVTYSPLDISGTDALPIVIAPLGNEPFGVVGFIGNTSGLASVSVRHTHISGGSHATINGAYLSGMLSIYRAGFVAITDSVIGYGNADDALNIKYGDVLLERNTFTATSSDAFDGDFVTGTIRGNQLADAGNDGFDFSGSDVTVADNTVVGAGDKCVSVGEATNIHLSGNRLEQCHIAIEIKDASRALIENNLIVGSGTTSFNIYQKKWFFDAPSATIERNVIVAGEEFASGLVGLLTLRENLEVDTVEALADGPPWAVNVLEGAGHE